jgi:hypothetical protein
MVIKDPKFNFAKRIKRRNSKIGKLESKVGLTEYSKNYSKNSDGHHI